jgi:hypothetical protein
MDPGPV